MSENRVALITGANKGIGLQIAKTSPGMASPCSSAPGSLKTVKQRLRPSAIRRTPFNST